MVWSVKWDKAFIVGGDGSRRLTPNFRLKEFRDAAGAVMVHRELVSALQILRTSFGKSITVKQTDGDGLGVAIESRSITGLLKAADVTKAHHLFETVEQRGNQLHLRIPNPANLPPIGLEQVLETAFSVTSAYETTGDRFQQVTGNFDGAGMSFGPAQWNFKSGTLVPLFREFQQADESALKACFTDDDDYTEWLRVMETSAAEQIAWADELSTGRGKHDIVDPWKGYFRAVGRVQKFRAIMVEQALRKYGAKLLEQIKYLQSLKPNIQIDHLRCVCALYDLVIQQGSLKRAHAQIEKRVKEDNPKDQFELVRIAVEERGRKANPRWQSDVLSRRLGILQGVPTTIGDTQRANINFYMLRDVRVRDAKGLITSDVSDELARVSESVASGQTLLA